MPENLDDAAAAAHQAQASEGTGEPPNVPGPDIVQLLDYRFRQLIASNLAQAAILSSEKPLDPVEIVNLYARIFVELYSATELERAQEWA